MPTTSPRRLGRATALLLVLALLAAACTGADEPAEEATDRGEQVDGDAASGGGGEVADVARAWLADTYGLDAAVLEELEVGAVTTTPGASHVQFVQTVQDIRVADAEITVHVLDSGEIQSATDDLVTAQAGAADGAIDQARALDVASKAVTGTVDGDPAVAQVWLPNGGVLQLAWQVELATTDPVSSWVVLVDAASAQVISAEQATFGRHGATPHGDPGARVVAQALQAQRRDAVAQAGGDACEVRAPGACVFLPDPIFAAGGQLDDPRQANQHLSAVALQGLTDPSALVGAYVDTAPPGVPVEPAEEDDGTWAGGRATPGFEAAMAYYWIDRVQRHIQDLGFTDVLAEPFPVYPVDPETVDNAFYSPSEGRIHLGVGSDGINEGEDAAGIVHEYGHAVLDAQAPGIIGSVEGGAYHESFGDLLVLLTQLPHRTGDLGCLFPWTESGECLRRLDSDKVYPDDVLNEVHADGEIYNGAVFDLTAALLQAEGLDIGSCPGTTDCQAVTDRVLTTLLASNTYLPNDPTLPDVAEAFTLANDAVAGGADADLVAQAFAAHGLADGGESMVDADGESMASGAGVELQVDITHSYRGDLEVVAGVLGPDSTDLCDPIVLAEPDDADDADNLIGAIDVTDTGCAAFAPPAPDQIWYLQATDTLAEDEGQINAFSVVVDGVQYLAGDLPAPIGDADPEGTAAFVAGAGEEVHPDGMSEMGGAVTGEGPVLTVDVSHSYVGDLDISAGVVDADAEIICSVNVLEPDPADDSSDGIAGDVDLSDCADLYPPSPQQRWYLLVTDTAAIDTGTVDQMTLTGPDGVTYDFAGVPVEIPDADEDGVALLLDGSGGSAGQAGGAGAQAEITASIAITHPYRGDLAVTAGVRGPQGEALCEVVVSAPDPDVGDDDVVVDASLAECARHYPPTPEQPWYVFVADTLAADTGTIESVSLSGPAGTVTAQGLPLDVPDADPAGVQVLLEGGGTSGAAPAGGEVSAELAITHTYVGDLQVNLGVTDAGGAVLCQVTVREPDGQDDADELAGSASFGECGAFYPPAADAVFYLEVIDTAAADTGTVDAFSVIGPDGVRHAASGLPAAIPDDDATGVVVGAFG